MKMFPTIAALALTLFVTGCKDKERFEFHSSGDGRIVWRCDRESGEVTNFVKNVAASSYELFSSSDAPPILLNKQTGATWRYYRNHDTNGLTQDEGFIFLSPPGQY